RWKVLAALVAAPAVAALGDRRGYHGAQLASLVDVGEADVRTRPCTQSRCPHGPPLVARGPRSRACSTGKNAREVLRIGQPPGGGNPPKHWVFLGQMRIWAPAVK
ncbi:unnamed protein product, partial [Discosporangium mesarthrocarpum]